MSLARWLSWTPTSDAHLAEPAKPAKRPPHLARRPFERFEGAGQWPRGTSGLHVAATDLGGWVIATAGEGSMRLVVATDPPWPAAVTRAAELVAILDDLHRRDRPEAQEIGDRLEWTLKALRDEGIAAWLVS